MIELDETLSKNRGMFLRGACTCMRVRDRGQIIAQTDDSPIERPMQ